MGTVFLDTLNRVAPVFLVIFLGVLLNKLHFFAEQTKADIVKLVFYVGTPCLIVKEIAASDLTQVMVCQELCQRRAEYRRYRKTFYVGAGEAVFPVDVPERI